MSKLDTLVEQILTYLHTQTPRRSQQILGIFAGTVGLLVCLWVLHVRTTNNDLGSEIQRMYHARSTVTARKQRFLEIEQQHERLLEVLNQGFTIKGFLLSFSEKHGIQIISDYNDVVTDLENNEIFHEISLEATIPGLTTKRLVGILQDLAAVPEIYIKELRINKETNNTITAIVNLATVRNKSVGEEQ